MSHTYACIDKAKEDFDYEPKMSLEKGLINTFEYLDSK